MDDDASSVVHDLSLPPVRHATAPSAADQVFDALKQRILTLRLPPGARISEADVARRVGVSRQPVREAFKRLAKLGFLEIRPQSSTRVSLISEEAVRRARFIRTALEAHTCREACTALTANGLSALEALLVAQGEAVAAGDREAFHVLDDGFHQEICVQSGVGYVWDLIHESKAHMDRIRMLTLSPASQRHAFEEHRAILAALGARDPDAAVAAITAHLSRILVQIEEIKAQDHNWFTSGGG